MKDIWNYSIVEAYNALKFEGIIRSNANIGDEIAIKNPDYHKDRNPGVPQKLFYYPIKVDKVNYLLPSDDIDMLPIKVKSTTKISVGQRAYERINEAVSIKLKQSKDMSYRDMILNKMPYKHEAQKEWLVWKIVSEVALRDKIFIRAISYPSWGKTSTFYIESQLRDDVEIIDGGTFAKMKYSLGTSPSALVLDEVDDLSSDEKRFLAKLIRSCGDGRGKVNNDSRAVTGTTETFDLTSTSLIALYNFPTNSRMSFFETNFHDKILDRMFPLLLDGGASDRTPMLQQHEKMPHRVSDEDKEQLDKFLRTSLYFHDNFDSEMLGDKKLWEQKHRIGRKRWRMIYNSIINGIRMFSNTIKEFHELEDVLYTMHKNYEKYKEQYDIGDVDWCSTCSTDCGPQQTLNISENLDAIEEEIL